MRETWRITESLTNTSSNIPPLTVNGKPVTAIKDKVDAFADTSEQTFTTNSAADRTFTVRTEQIVNGFLKQPLTDRMRATSPSEIAWIVQDFKPCKTAWPDEIQDIILQHLPRGAGITQSV
jgi:hypothetical protein